ncbi:uncharacterized protein Dyak_GE28552 [Drosophila yakuba]|uniref:Uncharacterized protein n=1 Tax=Drosophila yakuba TaxID=7245 RepID=A0A0R1E2A6_DROYA|nr:uncharacterized protein Dyak_GE28552 [Drosophila yakuba]
MEHYLYPLDSVRRQSLKGEKEREQKQGDFFACISSAAASLSLTDETGNGLRIKETEDAEKSELWEIDPLCTEGSGSACAEEREPSRICSVHSDSAKSVRREIFSEQVAISVRKRSAGKR